MNYIDNGNNLIRESDGSCIPKIESNRDYREALESGIITLATKKDNRPELLSAAWEDANSYGMAYIDDNARVSLLWISQDPSSSLICKNMINEVQIWWSKLWMEYARVRAIIVGGTDEKFNKDNVGECPYTIWEISVAR